MNDVNDSLLSSIVRLVLDWLNLVDLRDQELARIASDFDKSRPWTENDENERRTTPNEFKKPPTPATVPFPDLLSSQIAHRVKQQHYATANQYSTPCTAQHPPNFNDKLSPVEKMKPVTRINTQALLPINENVALERTKEDDIKEDEEEEESQAKRRKVEEPCPSQITSVSLENIQDDDFDF